MSADDKSKTTVYPVLGSLLDLWYVRVSGRGLGNCFYTYFHAVALAEKFGARIIAPPWFSLTPGQIRRGSSTPRLYWRMFKALPGDIDGLRKLITLVRSIGNRHVVDVGESTQPVLAAGTVNFVGNRTFNFTFGALHAHRDVIRRRLLGIVKDPVTPNHRWGQGGYIAVHVRLGDFSEIPDQALLLTRSKDSARIPLRWYIRLVKELRTRYPERPVYIFSDGKEVQLQPLLELGARLNRSASDMTDLLTMSGASILVGSNSTYARWAAFLGDMPSIWLKKDLAEEKPSAPTTTILYVPLDTPDPISWLHFA